MDWLHYDPYAQALAKIERGHARDRGDVHELLRRGLVDKPMLRRLFDEITPSLMRYPAVDPKAFAKKVDEALCDYQGGQACRPSESFQRAGGLSSRREISRRDDRRRI